MEVIGAFYFPTQILIERNCYIKNCKLLQYSLWVPQNFWFQMVHTFLKKKATPNMRWSLVTQANLLFSVLESPLLQTTDSLVYACICSSGTITKLRYLGCRKRHYNMKDLDLVLNHSTGTMGCRKWHYNMKDLDLVLNHFTDTMGLPLLEQNQDIECCVCKHKAS